MEAAVATIRSRHATDWKGGCRATARTGSSRWRGRRSPPTRRSTSSRAPSSGARSRGVDRRHVDRDFRRRVHHRARRPHEPGLSLLLGVANVRLGYWWNSHVKPGERAAARTVPNFRNRVGEQVNAWFPVQAHLFQEFTARFFGPNRERWYLSDGGHFENTACYELLRPARAVHHRLRHRSGRRLHFRGPGESRPQSAHSTSAPTSGSCRGPTSRRMVEPSFHGAIGVLDDFRTAERSAGPPVPPAATRVPMRARERLLRGRRDRPRDPVRQAHVTGDEPLDVSNTGSSTAPSRRSRPSDQYFDEAQWESYRALGEHVGASCSGQSRPPEAGRRPR